MKAAIFVSLLLLAGDAVAASSESWGAAAENKIYAQQLVNELMARNADLLVCGLHAVPPGGTGKDQRMIACNLDRIGKADDEDDMAVVKERKTILVPNAKEPDKFEVQVPLKDSTGRIIGACGFVFRYRAGDDEIELHRKGVALRDQLSKRISAHRDLFRPTK